MSLALFINKVGTEGKGKNDRDKDPATGGGPP